jgi:hypothetical protein
MTGGTCCTNPRIAVLSGIACVFLGAHAHAPPDVEEDLGD